MSLYTYGAVLFLTIQHVSSSPCIGNDCQTDVCTVPQGIRYGFASTGRSFLNIGDSIEYTCLEGYTLVGFKKRTCMEDGELSGIAPHCKLMVTCSSPSAHLSNGWITSSLETTYQEGAIISYTCNIGYQPMGDTDRICLQDGTWNGGPIACTAIDCGSPNVQVGAYTLLQGVTTYPSTLIMSCDGQMFWSSCNLNGKWAPSNPCLNGTVDPLEKPTCSQLPPVPEESYAITSDRGDFYRGRTVTYSCDLGYRYIGGFKTYECMDGGIWEPEVVDVRCLEITCKRPTDRLKHGIVDPLGIDPFHFGESITYSCSDSYLMLGDHKRTCQKDGTWSGQHPMCKKIECKIPSLHLDNGYMEPQDRIIFYYGEKITYKCKKGYIPDGTNHRTCRKNGTWSGNSVKCKSYRKNNIGPGLLNSEGICGAPPLPSNLDSVASKDSGPYFPGHKVRYTCADGYRYKQGSRTYRCTRTGDWWPPTANIICKEINIPRYSKAGQPGIFTGFPFIGLAGSIAFTWLLHQ